MKGQSDLLDPCTDGSSLSNKTTMSQQLIELKSKPKGIIMATATKTNAASRTKPTGGEFTINPTKMKTIVTSLQTALADLQRLGQEGGKMDGAGRGGQKTVMEETGVQIAIWEDEPFLATEPGKDPVAALPITVDVPEDLQPPLQYHILDPRPDPEVYDPSTADFRYWNADAALTRGINFWEPLLPSGTVWSTMHQPMNVQLDEGVDFNAFYARDSGLNFFHGDVHKGGVHTTVYSGESPDVVCHELGHAILDAVKPELFDAMSAEVGAFHEAFGDMSSMLSALQIPSFRDFVLQQTGGHLNVNSRLSQLARQLGWAIRVMFGPGAVDADCLRNTCNSFFYQDPAGLPTSGPASQLTSEVHNFSRVFSGAFLDVLAGMFQIGPAAAVVDDSQKLRDIANDAGKLLIGGIRLASVGSGFYSQVAAGMVQADQTLNHGRYRAALTSSFVQRGILSPSSAVGLIKELQAHGGVVFGVTGVTSQGEHLHLQFEGDNEGYKKAATDAPALPLRPLTTRFGVTLHVHMPSEPSRFGVVGAAVTGGSEKTYSSEEDARTFVEDLIQLDEIAHDEAPGVIPAELTSPRGMDSGYKTHRLVKVDGKTVVKRHHFSCGFPGCRHHH
jgi:hypothetical protein